jgi:ketosteroid isomerase-like protein
MADHPNVAMVRESFDAMGRGDLAWLDEHMSDDIVWHVGGNSSAAGTTRGKDAVRQMMTPPGPDTLKIDLHDIVGGDDHVVVLGTAVATGPTTGKSVEYNFVNVFHVADGKVTEVWGMAENDAEVDPIWEELAQGSTG